MKGMFGQALLDQRISDRMLREQHKWDAKDSAIGADIALCRWLDPNWKPGLFTVAGRMRNPLYLRDGHRRDLRSDDEFLASLPLGVVTLNPRPRQPSWRWLREFLTAEEIGVVTFLVEELPIPAIARELGATGASVHACYVRVRSKIRQETGV